MQVLLNNKTIQKCGQSNELGWIHLNFIWT
jgi:hypothetical protein